MLKILKKIFYSLPFGLKGAEDEIMLSKASSLSDDTTIQQKQENLTMSQALRQGEVTQEVEELRYKTYTVERESENISYIGEGVVIKKNKKKNRRIRFSQINDLICEDVNSGLLQADTKNVNSEKYRISINYTEFVRFKVEEFIKTIDVNIKDEIIFKLHFTKYADEYMPRTRPFINELNKIVEKQDDYYFMSHNEIISMMKSLSFITYKASDEENYVRYTFYDPMFDSIEENEHEYVITYNCDFYTRDDLTSKYFSESMDRKYKDKEKKILTIDFSKKI